MKNSKSINKLVEDSGMITHHKVIKILREKGWSLSIAPYYYDNISNTVREIDIVAEKPFNSAGIRNQSSVQINAQLFIECKFIKQEIIFWFDNHRDIDRAVEKLERDTNLQILHNKYGADITKDKFHYLCDEKVAKLFSTTTNKEDVIYKAITQCLNSKIYYDQWFDNPIHNKFMEHRETTASLLKYPVIVCNNFDNLLKVEFDDEKYLYDKLDTNFQLEVNYVYLDKSKTKAVAEIFLIDVVNFESFDDFLNQIDEEVKSVMAAKSFLI